MDELDPRQAGRLKPHEIDAARRDPGPVQRPMRAVDQQPIRRKPSTDQIKQRRQMARKTARKEPEMDTSVQHEAAILAAMRQATTAAEQQKLVRELDELRAARTAGAQADRDLDLAGALVAEAMTPVATSTDLRVTAASDWMVEAEDGSGLDIDSLARAMRTEASLWFGRISPEVRADHREFGEQAQGMAQHLASQHGVHYETARRAFLDHLGHLYRVAETNPKGTEVRGPGGADYDLEGRELEPFENFAPPEDPINSGVGEAEESSERFDLDQGGSGGDAVVVHSRRTAGDKPPWLEDSDESDEGEGSEDDKGKGEKDKDEDEGGDSEDDKGGEPKESRRSIAEVATDIARTAKVSPEAGVYLTALRQVSSVGETYGGVPVREIVGHFLLATPHLDQRLAAELRQVAKNPQSGHGEPTTEDVEVTDEQALEEAFPWELEEEYRPDNEGHNRKGSSRKEAIGGPSGYIRITVEDPEYGEVVDTALVSEIDLGRALAEFGVSDPGTISGEVTDAQGNKVHWGIAYPSDDELADLWEPGTPRLGSRKATVSGEDKEPSGAADVAATPTPGQEVADYPQPSGTGDGSQEQPDVHPWDKPGAEAMVARAKAFRSKAQAGVAAQSQE